jgi:hypothetical protein
MVEDINGIRKDIQEYIEVRIDLLRLHTAENISRILSSAVKAVITGYLLLFILLFLSFAGGYFFGSLFHSTELGFLCVAGFYLLVLLIFLMLRKQIVESPIIKAVVKLFFPKFNEYEKEHGE